MPITMRCLRKVRTIALRGFEDGSKSQGIFSIVIPTTGETVFRKFLPHGMNITVPINEGEISSREVCFEIRLDFRNSECAGLDTAPSTPEKQTSSSSSCTSSFTVNLLTDPLDLGHSLDSLNLPTTPRIFIRLANGIWTSESSPELYACHDEPNTGPPVRSLIETRLLGFSKILESAKAAAGLLGQRDSLRAELLAANAELKRRSQDAADRMEAKRGAVVLRRILEVEKVKMEHLEEVVARRQRWLLHMENTVRGKLNMASESAESVTVEKAASGQLRAFFLDLVAVKSAQLSEIFFEKKQVDHSIRGLSVSSADSYEQATALSFVVLIVQTVLSFLGTTCRNEFIFCGSTSGIREVSTGLVYPLFIEGGKTEFSRGLELLVDGVEELSAIVGCLLESKRLSISSFHGVPGALSAILDQLARIKGLVV